MARNTNPLSKRDQMRIRNNIESLRHRQEMTRQQLAYHAGITEKFLSRIINGQQLPSLPNAFAITHALGVSDIGRVFICELDLK